MASITTSRLVLRRWRDGDVAPMAAINADPLATEAARAALRFGLVDRGLERIVSIAQVGNDASERIMAKLGMHPDRQTIDPSCGRQVRVQAITRTQYLAATA